MSAVPVREFSYNLGALLARVESGETLQVVQDDRVIATLIPGPGTSGAGTCERCAAPAAHGRAGPKPATSADPGRAAAEPGPVCAPLGAGGRGWV